MSELDRFSTRADAYGAGRPSYPAASIATIFDGLGDPATLFAADLGAGTGISSRLLANCGAKVLAIEPNAAMRGAAQAHPGVRFIDGTAEHTTLEAGSVDAVTAFQAWHWFDRSAATTEAHRILRPTGRLAVIYNERDERDPFTNAYGGIVRCYATDATERRRSQALADAQEIDPARTRRVDVSNSQQLDRAGVRARAASSSYLPQSGPHALAMFAELDALFDRFASAGEVEMRLVTIVVTVDL